MQQISSKQLKCYGRRNRAKPEPSSLESGPPAAEDVTGATVLEGAVLAATSVQAAEVVVAQAKAPHAGRGRPRKVLGAPKQGEKAPGDVANKKVPATRSSVGRPVVPKAREAARVPTPLEGPVSEGSSLKAPGQAQERAPVRVRIVGPFSNGGSKHGRGKSFGSASPGSQKTRGQIARQEAERAAGEETGDGVQGNATAANLVHLCKKTIQKLQGWYSSLPTDPESYLMNRQQCGYLVKRILDTDVVLQESPVFECKSSAPGASWGTPTCGVVDQGQLHHHQAPIAECSFGTR